MEVSKFNIKYTLLMIALVYPIGYFYFAPQLRYVYGIGKWLIIALGICLILKGAYTPSKITLGIVALELYLLMVTVIREGNIARWMNYAIPNIAMAILVEYGISRKPSVTVKCIGMVGLMHLLINSLLGYRYDNGMNMYWLGLRVRIATYSFPILAVLLIAVFYFKKSNKGNRFWILSTVVAFILSVQFFLKEQVATAIVSMVVFLIFFLIFCFAEKITDKFPMKAWLIEIGINIGIVFFGIQSKFSWLIEGILGKSLTFTGRTTIWNSAFQQASKHFIFGSGIGTAQVFNANGVVYEHNQLLNLYYSGGLVALILFLLIVFVCMKKVCRIRFSMINKIMATTLLTCSIEMITEHPFENALFVAMLIISYHSDDISYVEERENDLCLY